MTTSNPLSHIGLGCFGDTQSGGRDSDVLYMLCWILSCPSTDMREASSSFFFFFLNFPLLTTTLSLIPRSCASSSGCSTVCCEVVSGIPFNEGKVAQGVQSSSRMAKGVWDDGFQAGVDKGDQSGNGVALPELKGGGWRGPWGLQGCWWF
jgi:hypothetical protein